MIDHSRSSRGSSWPPRISAGTALVAGGLVVAMSYVALGRLSLPAVGTFAGGVLAWRLSRGIFPLLTFAGAVFGSGIGVSLHAGTHSWSGRPVATPDLLMHLARDAAIGSLIGLVAIAPLIAASFSDDQSRPTDQEHGSSG
jgi:hypothetical protein